MTSFVKKYFGNILRNASFSASEDFTLLVLGQTGSGKTSFLNLLANLNNFDTADRSELQARLCSINDSSIEHALNDVMASKTSDASIYRLHIAEEMYITIIDTPGFGDSRGFEEDEKHVKRIVNRLRSHTFVHCVMLIVNGREARLNGTIRYVLAQLTSIMPKTVLDNVHVVFTNTESKTQCNFDIEALRGFGIVAPSVVHIENPYCSVMKLLQDEVSQAESSSDREEESSDDDDPLITAVGKAKFACKSLYKMFDRIKGCRAVHTHEFLQLNARKNDVERLIGNIVEKLQSGQSLQQQVKQAEQLLNEGHRPVPTTIETKRWALMPTDSEWGVCIHSGCHGNCFDRTCGPLPRGCHRVNKISTLGGAVVGLVGIGALPVAGGLAMLGTAGAGAVASFGAGAFVSGCSLFAAAGGAEKCTTCGHDHDDHSAGFQKWEEQIERHAVISDESLRNAANEQERLESALKQLHIAEQTLEKEKCALQVQLGEAIEQYEQLGLVGSYIRFLQQQLQGIRERIQASSSSHEIESMRRFEAELKSRLDLAERSTDWTCCICMTAKKDTRLGCGHLLCHSCSTQIQDCPICREPIAQRVAIGTVR